MIDEEGRLRRIDYGDRVYFDSVLGIAGTTYPIGTAEMPSNTIANLITICVAQNIKKIHVTGILPVGTGIDQDLVGHNSILTGQSAGAAYVRDIKGYLEIDAMVGGTLDIYAYGAEIQINADCTAGAINIYGVANVTNDSAAGCTVNNYTVPYAIEAMRGGTETLESLDDELDAIPDMAKVPDTRTISIIGTEETITALGVTGDVPFYVAGIWLGMENMAAGDVVRWRVFVDWDDASIADQLTDDEVWTFGQVQPQKWTYMPLNFWVTYEIVVKVTQLDGTAKVFHCVLDTGQRGS